jgi:hypothetical protein
MYSDILKRDFQFYCHECMFAFVYYLCLSIVCVCLVVFVFVYYLCLSIICIYILFVYYLYLYPMEVTTERCY